MHLWREPQLFLQNKLHPGPGSIVLGLNIVLSVNFAIRRDFVLFTYISEIGKENKIIIFVAFEACLMSNEVTDVWSLHMQSRARDACFFTVYVI